MIRVGGYPARPNSGVALTWREALQSKGATGVVHLAAFFASIDWTDAGSGVEFTPNEGPDWGHWFSWVCKRQRKG